MLSEGGDAFAFAEALFFFAVLVETAAASYFSAAYLPTLPCFVVEEWVQTLCAEPLSLDELVQRVWGRSFGRLSNKHLQKPLALVHLGATHLVLLGNEESQHVLGQDSAESFVLAGSSRLVFNHLDPRSLHVLQVRLEGIL